MTQTPIRTSVVEFISAIIFQAKYDAEMASVLVKSKRGGGKIVGSAKRLIFSDDGAKRLIETYQIPLDINDIRTSCCKKRGEMFDHTRSRRPIINRTYYLKRKAMALGQTI